MVELTAVQRAFTEALPDIQYRLNEPMAKHTSFRIGGPAEIMCFPGTVEELSEILKVSKMMDITPAILGAGTNILAPDQGISGIVICLKDALVGIELLSDTQMRVMAGATMTKAAVFAANHGLSGMEFAHGIPGSVGGGVYMNAGAYGGEICQICTQVGVMDLFGELHIYSADEMEFSYRHSVLEESAGIVVYADFSLQQADPRSIRDKMQELMTKRKNSQPLDLPSAGSAFKRPQGGYAAALIDQAGLKGFRVGDAAVSEKHAGFVVNLGNATAEDVKSLLQQVSERVYEGTGIRLYPEVRIW